MKGVENHSELAQKFLQLLEHYSFVCLHSWPKILLARAQIHGNSVQIVCTSRLTLFNRLQMKTGFRKYFLQCVLDILVCIVANKLQFHDLFLAILTIYLWNWAEDCSHRFISSVLQFVQLYDQLIAVAAGVSSSLARLSRFPSLFLSLQELLQPKSGSLDSDWVLLTLLLVLCIGGSWRSSLVHSAITTAYFCPPCLQYTLSLEEG